METACCFTGYRPKKFEFELRKNNPQYIQFENRLLSAIFSMPQKGCYTFYSGAAMGFDLIAAELVLLLKKSLKNKTVKLICVVPFENQARNWPYEWKQRYKKVLNQADNVVLISKNYFLGCYQSRNRYMVDHSNYIITYFDGKNGGTKNTLEYARKNQLEIINLLDITPPEHDVVYIFEKQEH